MPQGHNILSDPEVREFLEGMRSLQHDEKLTLARALRWLAKDLQRNRITRDAAAEVLKDHAAQLERGGGA